MSAYIDVSTSERICGLYRRHVRPVFKRVRRWYRRQAEWLADRRAAGTGLSEATALVALHSPVPRQRWEAAIVLGRNPQRSAAAVAALIAALADDEPFVRWQAAEALARQDVTSVFRVLTDTLAQGSPLQRAGVAEALGWIGGEAATNALCKQVTDSQPQVRIALARALGRIADPTTAIELVPMLDDADADVRRVAARAIGRIGSPGTALSLAAALARPGQPVLVRRGLAAALVRAAHPDAQPVLLEALADPDAQVRAYAAQALGQIGNEVAYARLTSLLTDRSPLLKGTVGDEARAARLLMERRGRQAPPATPTGESRP